VTAKHLSLGAQESRRRRLSLDRSRRKSKRWQDYGRDDTRVDHWRAHARTGQTRGLNSQDLHFNEHVASIMKGRLPHLDHNLKNGNQKRGGHEAIYHQQDRCEGTNLSQTTYTAVRTDEQDGDLQSVVPEDGIAHLAESLEDDEGRRPELVVRRIWDGSGEMRVSEHGSGEPERFVKSDCADKERKRFGECDGVHWDTK
jgi:hypothetical protein